MGVTDSELLMPNSTPTSAVPSVPERENSGVIFNTMRFSIHDGPGIRTTVFLKGCPLRCAWCHNPEGLEFRPRLMVFPERCRHCGDCVAACPQNEITDPAAGPHVPAECDGCDSCAQACVAGAREIAGRRTNVAELMGELERDIVFFDQSGGGITISGGEPLAQPEFTRGLLAACRERGIHVALDTCGFAQPETFQRVSALADLVLFDLKVMDSAVHTRVTGVSNEMIHANLRTLAQSGKPVVIRFPMIPGVNDSAGELLALAGFVQSCGLAQLDLLPYHRVGADKYARLDGSARSGAFLPPPAESISEAVGTLRRQGLDVRVGGWV